MPPAKKSLYDVILPGTHDTGAYRIPLKDTTPTGAPAVLAMPPLRWFLRRTLREFSKTQYGGVLRQLRAGSRYQDLRVSGATRAVAPEAGGAPDKFWLVHGAVACVPLGEVLADMARFAAEERARAGGDGRAPTVVSVVRLLGGGWDADMLDELAARFRDALGAPDLYQGGPAELREVEFEDLPPWVVVGVPGIGSFPRAGEKWGSDVWINTYDGDEKVKGLRDQLEEQRGRKERDGFYVLGWSVTPQPTDIAGRIVSCGIARPSLEDEAEKFNHRWGDFAAANLAEIRRCTNVVFFDFITAELAAKVRSLNEDVADTGYVDDEAGHFIEGGQAQ